MMWYNKVTGTLRTSSPCGGYASSDYMEQFYPDWEQVPDDFQPPIIRTSESKEEQIEKLDTQYQRDKKDLCEQFIDAEIHEDSKAKHEIREAMKKLDAEYDLNYSNIMKGI